MKAICFFKHRRLTDIDLKPHFVIFYHLLLEVSKKQIYTIHFYTLAKNIYIWRDYNHEK